MCSLKWNLLTAASCIVTGDATCLQLRNVQLKTSVAGLAIDDAVGSAVRMSVLKKTVSMILKEVIFTHLKYSAWIDKLPGGIQTGLVVCDFFLRDFALTRYQNLHHFSDLSDNIHFNAIWRIRSRDTESMDIYIYIYIYISNVSILSVYVCVCMYTHTHTHTHTQCGAWLHEPIFYESHTCTTRFPVHLLCRVLFKWDQKFRYEQNFIYVS